MTVSVNLFTYSVCWKYIYLILSYLILSCSSTLHVFDAILILRSFGNNAYFAEMRKITSADWLFQHIDTRNT